MRDELRAVQISLEPNKISGQTGLVLIRCGVLKGQEGPSVTDLTWAASANSTLQSDFIGSNIVSGYNRERDSDK